MNVIRKNNYFIDIFIILFIAYSSNKIGKKIQQLKKCFKLYYFCCNLNYPPNIN